MNLIFRAWDRKQYVYSEDIGLVNFFMNNSESTIEQSTGLVDKNGREVFFGDILEFESPEWGDDCTNLCHVGWDIEYGQISVIGGVYEVGIYCKIIGSRNGNPNMYKYACEVNGRGYTEELVKGFMNNSNSTNEVT